MLANENDLAEAVARDQPFAHGIIEGEENHTEQHDGRAGEGAE